MRKTSYVPGPRTFRGESSQTPVPQRVHQPYQERKTLTCKFKNQIFLFKIGTRA